MAKDYVYVPPVIREGTREEALIAGLHNLALFNGRPEAMAILCIFVAEMVELAYPNGWRANSDIKGAALLIAETVYPKPLRELEGHVALLNDALARINNGAWWALNLLVVQVSWELTNALSDPDLRELAQIMLARSTQQYSKQHVDLVRINLPRQEAMEEMLRNFTVSVEHTRWE